MENVMSLAGKVAVIVGGSRGIGRDVAVALAEASSRHIVWVDEGATRARLLHDKLRESLLNRLESDDRRELHLRAAEKIETVDRDRRYRP